MLITGNYACNNNKSGSGSGSSCDNSKKKLQSDFAYNCSNWKLLKCSDMLFSHTARMKNQKQR